MSGVTTSSLSLAAGLSEIESSDHYELSQRPDEKTLINLSASLYRFYQKVLNISARNMDLESMAKRMSA